METDLQASANALENVCNERNDNRRHIQRLEADMETQNNYVSHLENDLEKLTGYARHLEADIKTLNEQIQKTREIGNV